MNGLRVANPVALAVVLLAAACGPSPEAVATMTAEAWTPTPPPTATPTPVPFGLTVLVVDEASKAIAGARVTVPASGSDQPVIVDDQGRYSWPDLPGGETAMAAGAQGYRNAEQTFTLQRGPNEVTIALERDPFQLLPSEVCQPGQELLYLEDFEDGQAQDWPVTRPAWALEQVEGRGTVLTKTAGEGAFLPSNVDNSGNTVWLLETRNTSEITWLYQRYGGQGPAGSLANLIAFVGPRLMIQAGTGGGAAMQNLGSTVAPPPGEDGWHRLAIAYFNGNIDIWIGDTLVLGVTDRAPLESGALALETSTTEGVTSYDNLVICSLAEPYAPAAPQ